MRNIADLSLVAVPLDSSSETTFLQAFPSFCSLFTLSLEKCIPSCNLLANFLRSQSSLSSLLIAHSEDEKGFVPIPTVQHSDDDAVLRNPSGVTCDDMQYGLVNIFASCTFASGYPSLRPCFTFLASSQVPQTSLERLTIVIPFAFGHRPNKQLDFLEEEMGYFRGMMG